MVLVAAVCYLVIIGLGGWLLRLSYRLGVLKQLHLVRDHQRKPYPTEQAQALARPLALLTLLTGLAVLTFAVLIPVLRLKFGGWPATLGFIGAMAGIAKHIIVWRHDRARAARS